MTILQSRAGRGVAQPGAGTCPDVDALLTELRRRRWNLHIFGPQDAPHIVGAVLRWRTCADVVILRGEDDASAYRLPTFDDTDVFEPLLVSWQYHAGAAWTLRAVLTIAAPGQPGAPLAVERAAPGCTVPSETRRSMTLRPLWPGGTPAQ